MKLGLWVLGKNFTSALSTLYDIERGMSYQQELSLTSFDYLMKVASAKCLYCEVSFHPFPEYALTQTTDVLNSASDETGILPKDTGPSE